MILSSIHRHCVQCHNYTHAEGKIDLSGDWSPGMSMSYITLTYRNLFGDNRNRPKSDYKPYTIGSCASPLYKLVNQEHYNVQLTEHEKKLIRFWLNSGANYAGTYAANGNGIAWKYNDRLIQADLQWPETIAMKDVLNKRCNSCHTDRKHPLPQTLGSRSILFNITHPDSSKILTAPLAKDSLGRGLCKTKDGKPVFLNKDDPDYQTILACIERGKQFLLYEEQRFSNQQPIVPCRPYVREMVRFGILPPDHDFNQPVDVYETDQKYWKSLWYQKNP